MNYTQAQKSEAQFTTELESFLSKPEIAKVIALVHQYYFNPNDAIAQVWSFDDFSHLAPADISYEDSMKALAYLEDCDAFESDSEYLAMEHYFEEHNAKIDLPLAYLDNFGALELSVAGDILKYYSDYNLTPVAKHFFGTIESIKLWADTGMVYATDSDNNFLAINTEVGALDLYIVTPGSGSEGFLSDFDLDCLTDWDREYITTKYPNYL